MMISFPALTMLVCSGIVLLPTLLPVAVTDHSVHSTNTTSNGTFSELDKYSMGHIEVSLAFHNYYYV